VFHSHDGAVGGLAAVTAPPRSGGLEQLGDQEHFPSSFLDDSAPERNGGLQGSGAWGLSKRVAETQEKPLSEPNCRVVRPSTVAFEVLFVLDLE
jgi:hypothetical protein